MHNTSVFQLCLGGIWREDTLVYGVREVKKNVFLLVVICVYLIMASLVSMQEQYLLIHETLAEAVKRK